MLKINYWCDLFDDELPQLFTLFKDDREGLFYICSTTTFVGAIHKLGDCWQQTGGEPMPQKFIDDVGSYIDSQTMDLSFKNSQVYGQVNQ